MIAKVLEIFDLATTQWPVVRSVGGLSSDILTGPLGNRNKPIRLIMHKVEGYWVPMLVCDYCGKGPINGLSGDSCCDQKAPIS